MSPSLEKLSGSRKYPLHGPKNYLVYTSDSTSVFTAYYWWFPLSLLTNMIVHLSLTTQNSYAGTSQARVVPSTSYVPNRHKRSYEEDDEMDTQPQQMKDVSQGKKDKLTSLKNVFPVSMWTFLNLSSIWVHVQDLKNYISLQTGAHRPAESHGNMEPKRQETKAPSQDSSPSHCTSSLDLNFPLPGEKGPACLVKV